MGWLSKIFKGSSHKISEGHHQGNYGEGPNTYHNAPTSSKDIWSDYENEDIDRAIALSLAEESQNRRNVADKKSQLEEDEQLARALQESLNVESPPQHGNGHVPYPYGFGQAFQPMPTYYSTGYRICAGCNTEVGHGRFLSCMNAVWHPECFRCHACNMPISDYEFSMSRNHPYHKTCYKEHYHPRCDVCKHFIPTNPAGLIEYRAHPFWVQKYCPAHEHDGTPRCCSCERMELRDWLDLSLNHSVPSSLLILSRAFTVSGKLKPEEVVGATLSSLPDEVVDTVGITSLPSEDSLSERRRKLEYLEMQEELIKEEEEKEEEELSRHKDPQISEEDVALKEMVSPTAREAQEQARARTVEKREDLCQLSRALAVLASASSVSREREDFLQLVNKEIELYNSIVDKEGTDSERQAMEAYKAAREESDGPAEVAEQDSVSSALIDKVDAMLQNLEKEIDNVDALIGDRWRLLDRDYDGKVTPEEVAAAALYLKNTLGKEGIQELVSSLSKDRDGKILVEDIVRLGSVTDDANGADECRG